MADSQVGYLHNCDYYEVPHRADEIINQVLGKYEIPKKISSFYFYFLQNPFIN